MAESRSGPRSTDDRAHSERCADSSPLLQRVLVVLLHFDQARPRRVYSSVAAHGQSSRSRVVKRLLDQSSRVVWSWSGLRSPCQDVMDRLNLFNNGFRLIDPVKTPLSRRFTSLQRTYHMLTLQYVHDDSFSNYRIQKWWWFSSTKRVHADPSETALLLLNLFNGTASP